MKFMEYETNPGPGKMLITAIILGLVLAPFSSSYARPDVPPGKVSTPVYDYRDFTGPNVIQRVFEATQRGPLYFTVTENLTHLSEPGNLMVERIFQQEDGTFIRSNAMYFVASDSDYLWTRTQSFWTFGELSSDLTYQPPLSVRQTEMPKGAMQGGGGVAVNIVDDSKGGVTSVNTALGIDDILVPYGSISGCLRMFEEVGGYSRISWYCPDVGLAKRVWGSTFQQIIWELSDCTGCP